MIGLDEVGRGAWAGPLLVVAAKQLGALPAGLADSKVLSAKQRQTLVPLLIASCQFGEGWVTAEEIDKNGLSGAMRLAVSRALAALQAEHTDEIIMDGSVNYCSDYFTNVACVIKADSVYPAVSAASVYAKVTRDAYMANLGEAYEDYQFAAHVGYGTAAHKLALQRFGVSDQHRRSFKPVRALL